MAEYRDGYDRTKNPRSINARPMRVDEAKQLRPGDRVPFVANDGTIRHVTINGAPKTWKRTPGRCEVPVKYGMYEYGRFESLDDGTMERFVVVEA